MVYFRCSTLIRVGLELMTSRQRVCKIPWDQHLLKLPLLFRMGLYRQVLSYCSLLLALRHSINTVLGCSPRLTNGSILWGKHMLVLHKVHECTTRPPAFERFIVSPPPVVRKSNRALWSYLFFKKS